MRHAWRACTVCTVHGVLFFSLTCFNTFVLVVHGVWLSQWFIRSSRIRLANKKQKKMKLIDDKSMHLFSQSVLGVGPRWRTRSDLFVARVIIPCTHFVSCFRDINKT